MSNPRERQLPVAIFDVDHTLTRHSTGLWVALESVRLGAVKPWRLLAIPLVYLLYRVLPLSFTDKRKVGANGHKAIRGIPQALLLKVAANAFSGHIRADLYQDGLDLIEHLKAEGVRIVLATASFDIIVEPIARLVGAELVIANSFEFRDGKTTGNIERGMIFGEAKRQRCDEALAGLGFSLADCAFYSDSIHDLPLLKAAGKPVATNPDYRLSRHARRSGWERLRFRV